MMQQRSTFGNCRGRRMPKLSHIELEIVGHYALAKIKAKIKKPLRPSPAEAKESNDTLRRHRRTDLSINRLKKLVIAGVGGKRPGELVQPILPAGQLLQPDAPPIDASFAPDEPQLF